MKKVLALLLSGLFLYGCGMGGSGTTASSGGTTSGGGAQTAVGPAKSFTLKLVDGDKVAAKTITNAGGNSLPDATDVRVVIRRFEQQAVLIPVYTYDEEGKRTQTGTTSVIKSVEVSKDIQDATLTSSGIVTVQIPEASGYTIDIITSVVDASGNHSILKYGQKGDVSIDPNTQNVDITINTLNNIINMAVADTVLSKGTFNVNLANVLPLEPSYKMKMVFGNSSTTISSGGNTCTFTAPTSTSAGTVFMRGQFTLNSKFLKNAESQAKWARTFPNSVYGEEVSSQLSPLYDVNIPVQ